MKREEKVPNILFLGPVTSGSREAFVVLRQYWPGRIAQRHLPETNDQGYLLEETGSRNLSDFNVEDDCIIVTVLREKRIRLADTFLHECTSPWKWPESTYNPPLDIINPVYMGTFDGVSSNGPDVILNAFGNAEWQGSDHHRDETALSFVKDHWGFEPNKRTRICQNCFGITVRTFPNATIITCDPNRIRFFFGFLAIRYGIWKTLLNEISFHDGMLDERTKADIRSLIREKGTINGGTAAMKFSFFKREISYIYPIVLIIGSISMALFSSLPRWFYILLATIPFLRLSAEITRSTLLGMRTELKETKARKINNTHGREKKSIIVFTPLKVASSSLYIGLCDSFGVEPIQARMPYDRRKYLESYVKIIKIHNLKIKSGEILNDHDSGKNSGIRSNEFIHLICGFRDPIALYVSAYFQNNTSRFKFPSNSYETPVFRINPVYFGSRTDQNKADANELVDHFLGIDWLSIQDCNFDYYSRRILDVFGIDIYERPFDRDKGIMTYSNNNAHLLLYSMKALSANQKYFSKTISDFTGVSGFKLPRINTADERQIGEVMRRFRDELKKRQFPSRILEAYKSKTASFFWSEKQINNLLNNWNQG